MKRIVTTKSNFCILTGGPGSGKTSVLTALTKKGYLTVPEVGRRIIREQQLIGGNALHTGDRNAFLKLMLHHSLQDYQDKQDENRAIFFDRGLPDLYCYATVFCQQESKEVNQAIERYRYAHTVFLFPPWEAIYIKDRERQQDFKEAVQTYNGLKEAYQHCGYSLIEVPFLPVADRADFIVQSRTQS